VTNNEIFIILFAIVVMVFLGYAALVGTIDRVIGVKKHEREHHNILKGYNEIQKARVENSQMEKEEVA
jgi:hypothetical protein